MRHILISLILFLAQTAVLGQNKIDCRLLELVAHRQENRSMSFDAGFADEEQLDTASIKQSINVTFNDDGSVNMISAIARLKKDAVCPTEKLRLLGINVMDVVGGVAILNMPPESLLRLDEIEEIEHVAADNINHLMNSKAHTAMKVDYVDGSDLDKLADSNLPHAYTGKGVIIGVVDSGIDYNHAMFRDADGRSRVRKVVDFSSGTKTVYTDEDEIAALTTDNAVESHGSHTSCTAGGSRVGNSGLHGMAPDADLVLCGMGTKLSDSQIIESIGEVFGYADEVGKPAVINISIGNRQYFRDGVTSTIVQAVRDLNDGGAAQGRIVCFSAGNSAGKKSSIVQTLGEAGEDGYSLRTVMGETGTTAYNDIEMAYYQKLKLFAYDNGGGEFTAVLKAIDITSGTLYDLTEKPLYTSTTSTTPVTSLALTLRTDGINNKKYVKLSNSKTYYFHEPNLRLALLISGTQGQKMRIENGMIETSAEGFYSKGIEGFTEGNDELTINTNVCDDAVISVGAYTHSSSWKDINGKSYRYSDTYLRTVGSIATFSSFGTDDNGVRRPDVVAPGVGVLSAYNLYDITFFDDEGGISGDSRRIHYNENLNGRNNYYGVMLGTSMATPCVTGTIALWLQANPRLSTADVREIIRSTSDNDEYTTVAANIPSGDLRQAGSGKINALAGLQTFALALVDGEDYTATEDKTYADGVTYTRNFNAGLVNKWSSLYVPFAINVEDYLEQFDIAEILALCPVMDTNNDGEITGEDDDYLILLKKTAGNTVPNKPYLIRVKSSGDCEISAVDGAVYAAANGTVSCSTTSKNYVFTGTYSTVEANADNDYWYMGGGKISHMKSGSTNINGYRWYMSVSGRDEYSSGSSAHNSINIIVLGEDTSNATSIENIISGQISQPAVIYSVSGQKVNAINKGGIYIVNGRKIVR